MEALSVDGTPYDTPLTVDQIRRLEQILLDMGEFQAETIRNELDWFLGQLGLHEHYFQITPLPVIARHIAALKASRILNQSRGDVVDVQLQEEGTDNAIYVMLDHHDTAIMMEHRLEKRYPHARIQSFRTLGASDGGHLRLYFVSNPVYEQGEFDSEETDLLKIGDRSFLSSAKPETLERYKRLLQTAQDAIGCCIELTEKPETNETRLMVAVLTRSSTGLLTAISDAINAYDLHSNRKYREIFANGVTIFTVYFNHVTDLEIRRNLEEDISLLHVLPQTSVSILFQKGHLSAQAATYAYAARTFTLQFLTSFSDEYLAIAAALRDRPELMGTLQGLRTRLVKDSYTAERIELAITQNADLVQEIYENFASIHFTRPGTPLPSEAETEKQTTELRHQIRKAVVSETDRKILSYFLDFNSLILRTNFYKNDKVCLAFRLRPSFLDQTDYPELPYGVYFVVSAEFRAFHVRFRDVARGGIRLVRSANAEVYRHNSDNAFDENYNLARTQQWKNKDIPEGGSKGVILLGPSYQDRSELVFRKYIHGLLDLMLPNEEIRDRLQHQEILYLGPDEGTAELMDRACTDARDRNYPFWKAFTTGKSLLLGGVPHDLYGMTTNSVHEYVLRSLEKLGLKEEDVTKFQTGGPDGDLGSNEILISKDRTLGVVDGSGVLYDPEGIDRLELTRLARERQMVRHFDRARLSKSGFLVLLEDSEVTLPDGTYVESGVELRNTFHLSPYATADLFVPCGGRPRSVHINNWKQLLDGDGSPKFKIIVEGANLFFTQEARLELEKKGVVLFKDASANKGGVTSSSLEVLAALSLSDQQFDEWMSVRDDNVPEFRKQYVEQVLERIRENARLEFEAIWREHERTGQVRSLLSDQLSSRINHVSDAIRDSDLFGDVALRTTVVTLACPEILVESIGLPQILERVPNSYLHAVFASYIASRFIYRFGLAANEIDFLQFVRMLPAEA